MPKFRSSRPRGFTAPRVLLLLLAVSACSRHEPVPAVGANDEISVFTNTDPDGPVMEAIRRLFAYPVEVVGKEDAFRIDRVPFDRFHVHQYVKNQIFAVDLSGKDDLARALPGMLGRTGRDKLEAGEPFLLLLHDVWATGQTALFAVAWSRDDLQLVLTAADSTMLRREYEDSVVESLPKTMFGTGEEKTIPLMVAREFGWTLRLPAGFFAAEDPKGSVVKFNAADPVRLILIHWIAEPLPLTAEEWNPVLSRVLNVYNDGDFFMPERTEIFAADFQEEPALKWEGVWQNEKYVIGGPFRALAFHRAGESFLLVGIVFAPGQDKVHILRQVEGIMNTFRLVG